MAFEQIATNLEQGVLTITLNRPEKLNAYTAVMGRELGEVYRRADLDDDVRVLIITGAGRGFCAGADISAGADSFGGDDPVMFSKDGESDENRVVLPIINCRKPSIAAINGPAMGIGITMTLPMDIRIASEDARIGFIFARLGLIPEAGSAWFLPRVVGIQQALRWCYSGKVFGAAEALEGRLVSEVLPPEQLLPRAREIAREIADNTAPVSIAMTRQLLWRFMGEPDPLRVLQVDGPMVRAMGQAADAREGVKAAMEKRKPNFSGKVSTDCPPQYPWWDPSN